MTRVVVLRIDEDDGVAVIESTGLSDAPFLDSLAYCVVIRLDVPLHVALERVAARSGANLTNDAAHNERIWHEFYDHVAPVRHADLVIDTAAAPAAEIAAAISAFIAN